MILKYSSYPKISIVMKLSAIFALLICCTMVSCSTNNQGNGTKTTVDKTSVTIAEAVSKVSPEVKKNFDRLFDEWHTAYKTDSEISLSSRHIYPNQLPQYDRLVAMGESILPLVVEKMSGTDFYFSRLVYEGIRPAEKIYNTDTLGRERANYYIRLWSENHIHN